MTPEQEQAKQLAQIKHSAIYNNKRIAAMLGLTSGDMQVAPIGDLYLAFGINKLLKLFKPKMIEDTNFNISVFWSAEDQEYVAICAEVPSLSCPAANPTKAALGMIDALNNRTTEQ